MLIAALHVLVASLDVLVASLDILVVALNILVVHVLLCVRWQLKVVDVILRDEDFVLFVFIVRVFDWRLFTVTCENNNTVR